MCFEVGKIGLFFYYLKLFGSLYLLYLAIYIVLEVLMVFVVFYWVVHVYYGGMIFVRGLELLFTFSYLEILKERIH